MAATTQQGTQPTRAIVMSPGAPAASGLTLRFLGACEIRLNGKLLTDLDSRKAQALFVFVTMRANPVARDTLTALFWPEMAEQAAKNNLRTTLTSLKRRLGPYLENTVANIVFNRHLPYQLDVERLRTGLAAAVAAQDLAGLQAATALYQGEFLQGFYVRGAAPFEEWLLQQREELHLQVLRALEVQMTLALGQGDYTIGVDAGRHLLTLEPWSEAGHRQLMLLLALSGQRGRALQQYETCRRVLAAELDVEPTAETTALYRQIQTGQLAEPSAKHGPGATVVHDPAPPIALTAADSPSVSAAAVNRGVIDASGAPNNLFTPLTTFIGRQDELTYLVEQLTATECRLLTIVGQGGVGKSTLALALGQRLLAEQPSAFPSGIFFVSLTGVELEYTKSLPNHSRGLPIITAIAEAIGCHLQSNESPVAQLIAYLRPRRLLLILDNFEQLVACAEIVVNLLTNVPGVAMLITSRARLNLRGERVLTLQGLPLLNTDPDLLLQDARWQESAAVALFVDRAQTIDPAFTVNVATLTHIMQICQAVGGLPLAIEMTAAWLTCYGCAEIAAKLIHDTSLDEVLVSPFVDQPKRQQSIRQIFDDSWALLPATAQWTLARLHIFSRHFTRQAAQAVTGVLLPDLLRLRDHSLLQMDRDGLCSLHPLIKQFAAQQWRRLTQAQPQQQHDLHQAHSHYYLQQLVGLGQTVRGLDEFARIHTLARDHIELVRAWQWASQQADVAQLQRSMMGLWRYLELTNQITEGKALFGMALADGNSPSARSPVTRWLQVAHCHFMRRLAEHDQARRRLEALIAPALASAGGEFTGAETLSPEALDAETFALRVLGWVYYEQGEYALAWRCFDTVYRQATVAADEVQLAQALNGLGSVAFSTKRYADARQHYQAALTYAQQHKDLHCTAIILGNLAALAQATHADAEAESYLQTRLQLDQQTQNIRQMAVSNQRLGQLALERQAYGEAERYFRNSLTHFERLGNGPEIAHVLLDLSKSLLRQQQLSQAEIHCLHSLQAAIQAQMRPRILSALTLLAEIRLTAERKEEAVTLLHIVTRHGPLPAGAEETARKLQATVTAALGEAAIAQITQKIAGRSLQEFSQRLLTDQNRPPSPNLLTSL